MCVLVYASGQKPATKYSTKRLWWTFVALQVNGTNVNSLFQSEVFLNVSLLQLMGLIVTIKFMVMNQKVIAKVLYVLHIQIVINIGLWVIHHEHQKPENYDAGGKKFWIRAKRTFSQHLLKSSKMWVSVNSKGLQAC